MKKFMKFLKRHSKKLTLIASVTAVAALGVVAASAWGPGRPTYTMAHPADHVTFNSITDNQHYGNELTFFDIKDAANTNDGGWSGQMKVKNGQTVWLRTFVHNNAAPNLNGTNYNGVGVAKNTKVRIQLPTATSDSMKIGSFVSADNATPQVVYDDASVYGDKGFSLSYIPGSAVQYNRANPNGLKLSDSIVTTGAPIGYTKADGVVPGCTDYEGFVYVKAKVTMPEYSISKEVRVKGSKTWAKSITAQPGQEVEWRMQFQNTGSTQLNNIAVVDKTPAHTTSVAKSVQIYDANRPNGYTFGDNAIQGNLVNLMIGNYGAKSNAWIYFNSKLDSQDKLPCGETVLVNNVYATPSGLPTTTDSASVKINKVCNTPAFTIVKNVRKKGDTKWSQNVTVEYGDTVQYQILVKNTGNTVLKNVVVKDNRPTGVDYVNGTLKVNGATSTQDLFKAGVTVPSIAVNGQAEITFDAKVNKGQTDKCEVKKFQNIASAKPEGLTEKTDDANVTTQCKVTPAYECSAVEALALGGNKYRFTVQTKTSGGATVNKYVYNYGDATPEFNTDKNVVEHQYAKPGEYSVVVRVLFNVGSTQKEARCTARVVVHTNPCVYNPALPADSPECKPPTSVPPVTSIPSTGAGTVAAGIFGTSATAYGVLAMVDSRRALKKNLK